MALKWQEDKEFLELIEDLIEHEDVKSLEKFVHHKVTNRLAHSISVSYSSFCWARRLNLNTRAIARAGLLHDLFFYDWHTVKFVEGSHAYMHPRIAVKNAEKITVLTDLEKDIIIKHMWGATIAFPRYKESYIVTLVDKYCAIQEACIPLKARAKSLFHRKQFA